MSYLKRTKDYKDCHNSSKEEEIKIFRKKGELTIKLHNNHKISNELRPYDTSNEITREKHEKEEIKERRTRYSRSRSRSASSHQRKYSKDRKFRSRSRSYDKKRDWILKERRLAQNEGRDKSSSSRSRSQASSSYSSYSSSSSSSSLIQREMKSASSAIKAEYYVKRPEQNQRCLVMNPMQKIFNYRGIQFASQGKPQPLPQVPQVQLPQIPSHSGKELSNTLIVSSLGPDVNLNILEDIFREKCLDLQTSMPDNIRFLESLRVAYVIFPSISVCSHVLESLNGSILINGNQYTMDYTPNISSNSTQNLKPNKTSFTYISNVAEISQFTTAMETTVHEDWICEFCDCKNFSKRIVCFRCQRQKTMNCRITPVIKQKATVMSTEGQMPPSTSLMIRGSIIKETDETELLEIFSQYAQVKDIRLIRDRLTLEIKDFAFIEYFTIEEASYALEQIRRNQIKIRDNPIHVTFSKIRRPEDYKEMNDLCKNNSLPSYPYNNYQTVEQNPMKILTHQAPYVDCVSMNELPANNVINLINPVNLSRQEQEKLKNISHLQNMIEISQNTVKTFNSKDTKGETNLKREPTDREKVEMEMKKWKKKMEKKNKPEQQGNGMELITKNIPFEPEDTSVHNNQDDYETIIQLDTYATSKKEKVAQATDTNKKDEIRNLIDTQSIEGFVCNVCQRKFATEEKLKIHENMSALHKENLVKLSTK